MKNEYGETVKPQYEVVREVNKGTADDFDAESVEFIAADGYKDAVRIAKEESLKHSDTTKERIGVVCYFEDDTSSYNQVWVEYYENGKKEGRYEV